MPAMQYTAKQVGAALRRARKLAGLTQQAAADQLEGVTKSMVSEWETAARDPQTSNLVRLLDLYGVTFARWGRLLEKENEDEDEPEDPTEALELLTARVDQLEAILSRPGGRPARRLRL